MSKVQNQSTKNDPIIKALPAACADEKTAVEFMEKQRWDSHPDCPVCASGNVYMMMDSKTHERQANYRWRCRECKKQFTVRTGTVFEGSAIELRHWCFAFWRASTSKKGVSALEIHRQTGVSYKSCLFMLHRIRFAMQDNYTTPLTGDVEVDETYVGGKPRHTGKGNRYWHKRKQAVMAMVERNGKARMRPIADVTGATLQDAIRETVHKSARIITDEHKGYHGIGRVYDGGHETVNHSRKQYVKKGNIHTNTVEGLFSIMKRGINGIYHAVSKEHLHRYAAEFEFRYNNRKLSDGERTLKAIRAAEGKRLLYKQSA